MSTIGDLAVTSSVSSDDKLPVWSNANGVTRGLPISVLDSRYLTQADVALLAASATVETFVAGVDFTPGVSLALTLAHQYYSSANIEVFFDASFQGIDQYTLAGFGLVFTSPIPVGVQKVFVRGGAARLVGAPSDGTVTDASLAPGSNVAQGIPGDGKVTDIKVSPLSKLYNRITDIIDVKDFGAKGDGVTDDVAAFSAAFVAAQNLGNAKIFIPAGQFNLSSSAAYTFPSASAALTIEGAGSEVTKLKFASGGLTVNWIDRANSLRICGLSILTDTNGVGIGLNLNQTNASIPDPGNSALNEVADLTLRGSDGVGSTHYWGTAIKVFGVSNINFDNVSVFGPGGAAYSAHGTGIDLSGSSLLPAVVYNFHGCVLNLLNSGINYGLWVQGVVVSNTNFTGDSIGISVPPSITGTAQLCVTNSQFNCTTGIDSESAVGSTSISNNAFLIPQSGVGMRMGVMSLCQIFGNSFAPTSFSNTAGFGILVISCVLVGGVITGNSFYFMKNAAILLDTASTLVNVQSNAYAANALNVVNNGTGNTVGGGSQ